MVRALVLLIFALPAFADVARTHDITIDDYETLAMIRELAVSPDGKFVAYTEARWDKGDDLQKTDLWVVATDGKSKPTRLTGDRANDRHPKWSHDGKAIYVLGNRKSVTDGKTQVWCVPAACGVATGATPQAVTKVEGGVTGFDYAPKADALFYSVDATATDKDDFTALRNKTKLDYGHGSRKVSEIYRLDLQSWRADKVIADGRYVREFAVTQDGKRVAMISAFDDSVVKSEGESRVDIWEDGKVVTPPTEVYRAKAASPHAWLENLCWNPAGMHFAFTAVFDAFPAEVIVGVENGADWKLTKVGRTEDKPCHLIGYGRAIGTALHWTKRFLVGIAERNGETGIFLASDDDWSGGWNSTHGNVLGFGSGRETNVFAYATARQLPVLATKVGDEPLIADPNSFVASWRIPEIKHITWKAPDGTEVGGVLELPPGYKKGDKLPLVVGIHGGPTTSTKAELSYDPHNGRLYFAAHGYAVLFPNYRGSTGYGDKFVTDLIGHENDIEVKDILAGIQHLIKEGIADPERIGVMGWSNGGYLTNCLITLKDSPVKFKAASSGAGIMESNAQWGMNDEPAYMAVFKKGLPWEVPDAYRRASPMYGLGNVTTPTLIHVGGNDDRCPPGHSRMLYRALKEYQKVPTELVVYPGQPHGLQKLSYRKAKMEWDLAWFDKYVKGK